LGADFSLKEIPSLDSKIKIFFTHPPLKERQEKVNVDQSPPQAGTSETHPYAAHLFDIIGPRSNGEIKIKLRKLLRGFGYERRTEGIVSEIHNHLGACNLLTDFSLTEPASIDDRITIHISEQGRKVFLAAKPKENLVMAFPSNLSDLAEKSSRATVEIFTDTAQGSGFIIDPDGLVVTGRHVVDDDGISLRTVKVRLSDGNETAGTVFCSHRQLDFALLWLKSNGPFPYLQIGNPQALRPAQTVLAIGSPSGFSKTVTQGIVSNPNQIYRLVECIQTDTIIDHGNSGGPLIAADGVVGITLWGWGNVASAHFAVPIDYLTEDINEAIRYGKKGCVQARYCRLCGSAEFVEPARFCQNCGLDFSSIREVKKEDQSVGA
jgi:ribosomal protein L37E